MSKHISETRTETLVLDLLTIQGWDVNRPPNGCLVRQNEYKVFLELEDIFKGKSKTGSGDAYPDFLLVSKDSRRPLMVIEAKADERDLDKAMEEALHYADACRIAGHQVIAAGIAGQERTEIRIGVSKYCGGTWTSVIYSGKPISWIPVPDDVRSLLSLPALLDLAPIIPKPEVLANKADLINRILREAYVKDEYRPANECKYSPKRIGNYW